MGAVKQSISLLFTGLFAAAAAAVYLLPVPSFYHEMPEALALFFMGTTLAQQKRSKLLVSGAWIAALVALTVGYVSPMVGFSDPFFIWRNMIYAVGLSSFFLLGYLTQLR